MKSMLEYLASLRQYGHTPEYIGEVTIGRTVYAAGRFVSPERDAPEGSRAAREGRSIPAETRIALKPIYRTDWVTWNSAGPTPPLLPPSAKRHAVYVDNYGMEWFIAGWNERDDVLWLNPVGDFDIDYGRQRSDKPYPRMPIDVYWREPFAVSMRLASPEVLARIDA
jgi:hypothetical protein